MFYRFLPFVRSRRCSQSRACVRLRMHSFWLMATRSRLVCIVCVYIYKPVSSSHAVTVRITHMHCCSYTTSTIAHTYQPRFCISLFVWCNQRIQQKKHTNTNFLWINSLPGSEFTGLSQWVDLLCCFSSFFLVKNYSVCKLQYFAVASWHTQSSCVNQHMILCQVWVRHMTNRYIPGVWHDEVTTCCWRGGLLCYIP